VIEAKAAFGLVELVRGDAEIEHDAVDRVRTQLVGDVIKTPKGGLNELNTFAEGFEPRACFANGFAVEVEADQASVRCGFFEDRGGMSATA